MEVRATAKYIRVQPRKVRIIADEVRGTNAVHTAGLLRFHKSKSAKALRKVLMSAVANTQANVKEGERAVPPERLKIVGIFVDEGPVMKRMRARAMGRGARILKKTSHITVIVSEDEELPRGRVTAKPAGTKAKPRPTFGTGRAKRKAARAASADDKMTITGSAIPAGAIPAEPETVAAEQTSAAEATATEESVGEAATEPAADDEGAK